MTTVKGERLINISATADETYVIDYSTSFSVSIFNHTDGIVSVALREQYASGSTASGCIKIAAGAFGNNLKVPGSRLYLTPAASGDISVMRVE